MNVLVITSSYPRYENDIAGIFVREHNQLLGEAGHRVRTLVWSDDENRRLDDDVRVVRYAPSGFQRLFYRDGAPENIESNPALSLLVVPAFFTMLEASLEHADWADLIIGHWLVPAGLVARACGWLSNTSSLVITHSGGIHMVDRLPLGARRVAAKLLRGPMTVPSRALEAKLRAIGLNAEVLPMGVAFREAHEPSSDDWLVMSRLVPIKRIDLAIRAFADASVGGTLHIAGDGPERPSLEALARALKVDAVFHGWTTGDAKDALLERCRFFLFPSQPTHGRFEGFPTGLLTAQLAGLTPLVSNSPGLDEAVFDASCIVNSSEVGDWAKAIEALARKRPAWRDAHEFARRFTWEALRADWQAQLEISFHR